MQGGQFSEACRGPKKLKISYLEARGAILAVTLQRCDYLDNRNFSVFGRCQQSEEPFLAASGACPLRGLPALRPAHSDG